MEMENAVRERNFNWAMDLRKLGADYRLVEPSELDHFFSELQINNLMEASKDCPEAMQLLNAPFLKERLASEFRKDYSIEEVDHSLKAD